MTSLKEGLRKNDLKDLVLPIISIDEYESKIEDSGIVVGFYTQYKDPANDLNRFIQKSAIDILDSEVSPAPTEDGYFVVFVEMERSSSFPQDIIDLVETLGNLVGFNRWQFKTIDKNIYKLDKETLNNKIDLTPDSNQSESIEEFFKSSILDDLLIEDQNITFIRNNQRISFELQDYTNYKQLHESPTMLNEGVVLTEAALCAVRRIGRYVGPHWLIEHFKNCIVLSNPNSDNAVVLKV